MVVATLVAPVIAHYYYVLLTLRRKYSGRSLLKTGKKKTQEKLTHKKKTRLLHSSESENVCKVRAIVSIAVEKRVLLVFFVFL